MKTKSYTRTHGIGPRLGPKAIILELGYTCATGPTCGTRYVWEPSQTPHKNTKKAQMRINDKRHIGETKFVVIYDNNVWKRKHLSTELPATFFPESKNRSNPPLQNKNTYIYRRLTLTLKPQLMKLTACDLSMLPLIWEFHQKMKGNTL